MPKLGRLKLAEALPGTEKPDMVTFCKDAIGRYFVSFATEIETSSLSLPIVNRSVGVDLGLTHLATLSRLAALYGVTTRRLNEQVRRNRTRFPEDFLFELTTEEFANLKSHFATSSWGGRRKLPLAFTEHGAIQAATILNSPRAVEMSVYVVRAFVKLRELLVSNKKLARRLDELEARLEKRLTTHDQAIAAILSAIRQLMNPPPPKRRPIGFTADPSKKS